MSPVTSSSRSRTASLCATARPWAELLPLAISPGDLMLAHHAYERLLTLGLTGMVRTFESNAQRSISPRSSSRRRHHGGP